MQTNITEEFFRISISHQALTFTLLFLPEFIAVNNGEKALKRFSLYRQLGFICVISLLAWGPSYLALKHLGFDAMAVLLTIFNGLNIWHLSRQSYGFSVLLGKQRQNRKLMFIGFCIWAVFFASTYSLTPRLPHLLTLLSPGILLLAGILYSDWQNRSINGYSQMIFDMRLLLYIFIPFSFFAFIGIGIIHNIEYWLLYGRIFSRSQVRSRNLFVFLSVFWVLAAVVLSHSPILTALSNSPLLQSIAFILVMSLTTTHFIWDGFLFRFSNEATRRNILPLVENNRAAS